MVVCVNMKRNLQDEAIGLVRKEVQAYDNPEVFITDRVSFAVKPLIRKLRKNYWGVFDNPVDKITGKKKIWAPLTQLVVDSTRKNVDLDPKDVTFRSKRPGGWSITQLIRAFTRDYLGKTYFGEDMDDLGFSACVDPIVIMKFITTKVDGKTHIVRKPIDPLNIYVDPQAKSIQQAQRFTERGLMGKDEMRRMTGWINVEDAHEQEHAVVRDVQNSIRAGGSTKYVDVYEMWGLMPKYFITGKEEDTEEIEGHIVVSGLDGGNGVLHLVEKNTKKDTTGKIIKPYEDTRYFKIPWSFYGISPAWMVMDIQEWMNTIINLRINKNTIAQLGLFKVRTGSNINTQSLTRLVSNGVIKVQNMDDLDNFQIPEAGVGSYKDEDTAKAWATEVTSAYDIVRGTLPSTSTATAAVIQDRNAKSSFVIVRDGLARFWEKAINRHFLPASPAMLKEEGVIRYMDDFEDIAEMRERVVAELAYKQLHKMDTVPTEQELLAAMAQAEGKLRQQKDIFIEVVSDIIVEGIDTEVVITNEKLDVGTTAQNLIAVLGLIPEQAVKARNEVASEVFNILGLSVPAELRNTDVPAQQTKEDVAVPDELGQFTQANTFETQGGMI